jgi:hypothetical protein
MNGKYYENGKKIIEYNDLSELWRLPTYKDHSSILRSSQKIVLIVDRGNIRASSIGEGAKDCEIYANHICADDIFCGGNEIPPKFSEGCMLYAKEIQCENLMNYCTKSACRAKSMEIKNKAGENAVGIRILAETIRNCGDHMSLCSFGDKNIVICEAYEYCGDGYVWDGAFNSFMLVGKLKSESEKPLMCAGSNSVLVVEDIDTPSSPANYFDDYLPPRKLSSNRCG